jgi:hypothetical protein
MDVNIQRKRITLTTSSFSGVDQKVWFCGGVTNSAERIYPNIINNAERNL